MSSSKNNSITSVEKKDGTLDAPEGDNNTNVETTKLTSSLQQQEPPPSFEFPTLLQQIENCLAQSLLIFLLADLRLLSATGRIGTRYETLSIDSDIAKRTNADTIAGLNHELMTSNNNSNNKNETTTTAPLLRGISPAHIMTVLFVEIINECELHRKMDLEEQNNKDQKKKSSSIRDQPSSILNAQNDSDLPGSGNSTTIRGRRIKNYLKNAEGDIHSLLRSYLKMIRSDIKYELPKVDRGFILQQGTTTTTTTAQQHLQQAQQHAQQHIQQAQQQAEEKVGRLKSFVRKKMNQTGGSTPFSSSSVGGVDDISTSRRTTGTNSTSPESIRDRVKRRTRAMRTLRRQQGNLHLQQNQLETVGDFEQIEHALMKFAGDNPTVRETVVRDSLMATSTTTPNNNNNNTPIYCGKDELRALMARAIESRDQERVKFVKDFFKTDSICRVVAESSSRWVWLHDWYPTKECTYAISIDPAKLKVLLVFRGAITSQDWSHAFDSVLKCVPNPIHENYDGKLQDIRLHAGFHRYLFRRRKDTGTTKYDEICNKVHEYGTKRIGDGYRVEVTGHSLGGALSTLWTFYASTERRFTKNAPIYTTTFGAPYLAGYEMAKAFRHQEQTGKIRYVRVHCVQDGIPHAPPSILYYNKTGHGARYFHVGIDVRMPMIRKGIFGGLLSQPIAKIDYVGEETAFKAWTRQFRNCYFWNIPYRVWLVGRMHTLVEHQERITLMSEHNVEFIDKTLAQVYEHYQSVEKKV